MSYLKGLTDYFPKLAEVKVANVSKWLGGRIAERILEDRLGNKLLYPQVIPVSVEDLDFDLVLLREALKTSRREYLNENLKRIQIPEFFLERFPNLEKLVRAFIDAFPLPDVTTVTLKSESVGTRTIGAVIRPKIYAARGSINIWIHQKKFSIKIGSSVLIPTKEQHLDIKFESIPTSGETVARLFDKERIDFETAGGQLGLLVDTRGSIQT